MQGHRTHRELGTSKRRNTKKSKLKPIHRKKADRKLAKEKYFIRAQVYHKSHPESTCKHCKKTHLQGLESSDKIPGVLLRFHIFLLCISSLTACKCIEWQQQGQDQKLRQAAKTADTEKLEQLLKNGANPNAAFYKKETLTGLLIQQYKRSNAAQRVSIENAVSLLLRCGADPNALHHGFTPLQIATGQGSQVIVSRLLTFGANPNKETRAGLAPIWQAVYDNNYTIGLTLLKAGANPNAKNTLGQTPLEYLKSKGYSRTRLMLHLRYYGGH